MAVSTGMPQLEEAWIAVQFRIAGLTVEFDDDVPDIVFNVRDDAWSAINGEYRGLPSMYRGEGAVEVPAYDICADDAGVQQSGGHFVLAVSFVSGFDFTREAIDEIKALCIEKFAEAAAAHGVSCAFAGIEGWRRLSYMERAVIEAV